MEKNLENKKYINICNVNHGTKYDISDSAETI